MAAPHARVVKFLSVLLRSGPTLPIRCAHSDLFRAPLRQRKRESKSIGNATGHNAHSRWYEVFFVFVSIRDIEKFSAQCNHAANIEVSLRITDPKRSHTHPSSTILGMKQMRNRRRIRNSFNACVKQKEGEHCFGQFRHRCLWVQELSNQVCLSFGFPCGLDMYMSVSDAPVIPGREAVKLNGLP